MRGVYIPPWLCSVTFSGSFFEQLSTSPYLFRTFGHFKLYLTINTTEAAGLNAPPLPSPSPMGRLYLQMCGVCPHSSDALMGFSLGSDSLLQTAFGAVVGTAHSCWGNSDYFCSYDQTYCNFNARHSQI